MLSNTRGGRFEAFYCNDKYLNNSIEVDSKDLDYTDMAPVPRRIMAIKKQASHKFIIRS